MSNNGPPRTVRRISAGADGSRTDASETGRDDEPSAPELILNGRRYRLVPVEREDLSPFPGELPSVAELLTEREVQIVTLVAHGRVNKQIADDLRISEWTVSTHLRRIFAKLGVDTRAAMVSRCGALLRQPPVRARPREDLP